MSITKRQSFNIPMTGTTPLTGNTFGVPVLAGSLLTVQSAHWGNNTSPTITVSDGLNGSWAIVDTGVWTQAGNDETAAVGGFVGSAAGNPSITVTCASGTDSFGMYVVTEWTTTQVWALDTSAHANSNGQVGVTDFSAVQPVSGTTPSTTGVLDSLVLAVSGSSSSLITGTSLGYNTPSGYTSLLLQNSSVVTQCISADYKTMTNVQAAQSTNWGGQLPRNAAWASAIGVWKETAGSGDSLMGMQCL